MGRKHAIVDLVLLFDSSALFSISASAGREHWVALRSEPLLRPKVIGNGLLCTGHMRISIGVNQIPLPAGTDVSQ